MVGNEQLVCGLRTMSTIGSKVAMADIDLIANCISESCGGQCDGRPMCD